MLLQKSMLLELNYSIEVKRICFKDEKEVLNAYVAQKLLKIHQRMSKFLFPNFHVFLKNMKTTNLYFRLSPILFKIQRCKVPHFNP